MEDSDFRGLFMSIDWRLCIFGFSAWKVRIFCFRFYVYISGVCGCFSFLFGFEVFGV